MSTPLPFACGKTDAVLALHLDGDLDAGTDEGLGYAFVDGQSLHQHLRGCADCQLVLRRARRLDAALANAAGVAQSTHERRAGSSLKELEARWFGAVATRLRSLPQPTSTTEAAAPAAAPTWPTPTPVARVAIRPPVRVSLVERSWLLPAAAIAAAAAVMAWRVLSVPATELVSSPTSAVLVATRLADQSPRRQAATGALPAPSRARPVRPAPRLAEANQRLADTPASLAHRLLATGFTTDERHRAVLALVAASRPAAPAPRKAHRALVDALAALGDADAAARALHVEVLASVRSSRDTRSLLGLDLVGLDAPEHRLERDDLAAITVAARLGDRDLDQHLRRVGRRHHDTLEVVAAALRCGARSEGGGQLLLDLWRDREAIDGDLAMASGMAAFRGQPTAMFAEVADLLRQSRVAPRRRQCLLALGCAADTTTVPTLLECAQSSHHDEAHVAGFALAALPPSCLDGIVAAATAGPAHILRAALARADHPAAQPWLATLALTAAERSLLQRGPLARFPVVAGWFRDHGGSAD